MCYLAQFQLAAWQWQWPSIDCWRQSKPQSPPLTNLERICRTFRGLSIPLPPMVAAVTSVVTSKTFATTNPHLSPPRQTLRKLFPDEFNLVLFVPLPPTKLISQLIDWYLTRGSGSIILTTIILKRQKRNNKNYSIWTGFGRTLLNNDAGRYLSSPLPPNWLSDEKLI